MNDIQIDILKKIIDKQEKQILNELLDYLLDQGLGSTNKREFDIFLFHLLEKYNSKMQLSNYDWSSLLKISERKVKNLRIETGIRFHSNDKNDESKQWIKLLDLIRECYIECESTKNFTITIEDPYLLRFLDHQLKQLKLPSADYSFNPERIRFKNKSLEKLIKEAAKNITGEGNSKAEKIIKSIKWSNYGKEGGKELYDIFKRVFPKIILPTP